MKNLKKNVIFLTLVMAVVAFSGVAFAANEKPEPPSRTGPPNFGPSPNGTGCQGATVSDLQVTLQIQHTWVGDLAIVLNSPSSSAQIVNRAGNPASTFGCSSDDIDAVLSDGGGSSVENACNPTPPAISGNLTPDPDALSAFNGETLDGTWSLAVTDHAGGDSGRILTWCLAEGAGEACCASNNTPTVDNSTVNDDLVIGGGTDGSDGTSTPAVGTWGIIAMISLLLAASLFHFRRRAEQF
jgi:subtilisin-like proprotein convertase family protein